MELISRRRLVVKLWASLNVPCACTTATRSPGCTTSSTNRSASCFASSVNWLSNNTYEKYLVDSVHYNTNLAGHFADFSGNKVVGVPSMNGTVVVGIAPAELKGLGFKLGLTRVGEYFADDANVVRVPSYSVVNATIAFNRLVSVSNGVGIRGFLSVNNLADKTYISSAFLNPDVVGGVPVAFEPGLPRNVTVSFALERLR